MVRVIIFLILFPSNSIAQDYLLNEMVKNWTINTECNIKDSEPEYYESVPDYYDSSSDSWDNLYIDPYENTEIIY